MQGRAGLVIGLEEVCRRVSQFPGLFEHDGGNRGGKVFEGLSGPKIFLKKAVQKGLIEKLFHGTGTPEVGGGPARTKGQGPVFFEIFQIPGQAKREQGLDPSFVGGQGLLMALKETDIHTATNGGQGRIGREMGAQGDACRQGVEIPGREALSFPLVLCLFPDRGIGAHPGGPVAPHQVKDVSPGFQFIALVIGDGDTRSEVLRDLYLAPDDCRDVHAKSLVDKTGQGREQGLIGLLHFFHDDLYRSGSGHELLSIPFGQSLDQGRDLFAQESGDAPLQGFRGKSGGQG